MKKFLKILLVIVLIPVFIIGGALGFLKFADLNKYKPQIEEMAQKYAGLDVKINGDIDVGVSLKPSLQLSDVTINQGEKKIAHIGNALVQISVMPLFHKEIVIDRVKTDNTEVFYGDKNSVLINELNAGMEDADTPIEFDFDTSAANIDITGKGTVSALNKIKASGYNQIDVDAAINALGYVLNFDGTVDGLKEKVKAAGKYELTYKSAKISGQVSADTATEIPYIKMNASSDALSVVEFTGKKQAVLGNGWLIKSAAAADYIPNTQIPYDYLKMVNADITLDVKKIVVDKDIVLTNVKGDATVKNGVFKANIQNVAFKGNTISGSAEITSPKALPYIKLNIKGDGFNLMDFQKNTAPKAADKKAELMDFFISSAQASELMANTPIPYQYLKMAHADVNLNLKKIQLNKDISLTDVRLSATLKNSVLNTNIQNITAGSGTVSGTLTLNGAKKSMAADITGKNIILQQFYTPLSTANNEVYFKNGGKSNLLLKINTSGDNTDQYLANMNGQIIGLVDQSVLQIKSLEKLKGNILVQALSLVKLNVTNKDLNLKCAVVRGDISGGTVNFPKGIAIDAKDFYLVADGKLNMKNDKINMDLKPFSGSITDVNISNVLGGLVKVTGTVKNPKLGLNQTETAKNVVGILASGGAYNVGDMIFSADGAPCHTALEGTAYATYFPADKSVKGAVSGGYTNTKDAIKGLGTELKNQAKGAGKQVKELGKQLKGLFK
ncbi:MAG: AsmA family protein [Alphaproteobacteria bacterium]|nr:AsmA family protein [Alphaproteobacteria bacterium]